MRKRQQSDCKDWACRYCQSEQTIIYWDNLPQKPTSKCRCCGSTNATVPLRTSRKSQLHDQGLPLNPIVLDHQIVEEWDQVMERYSDSICPGCELIDSCPMIQKLCLMMKYYHIHIGKHVVNVDDERKYRIDSMSDLVENLNGLSLAELVNLFEHVSTVHRKPQMFGYFIETIGPCDDDAACDSVRRNRGRRRSTDNRDVKRLDSVERHYLSFFDKWHSFLFHPQYEDKVAPLDSTESIGTEEVQIEMLIKPKMLRQHTGKYTDYSFGVWIDYTANSPFFDSMKEEMMENEIYSMTSDQWQSTLMKALTHLDSEKINKYTAKREDEKFGIEIGQEIGTENVMAILIYCNYTDLQTRFSETFREMQDDDTDETIIDRHCRNYYWLGRCVISTFRSYSGSE